MEIIQQYAEEDNPTADSVVKEQVCDVFLSKKSGFRLCFCDEKCY